LAAQRQILRSEQLNEEGGQHFPIALLPVDESNSDTDTRISLFRIPQSGYAVARAIKKQGAV
jgi:hypothetical protein